MNVFFPSGEVFNPGDLVYSADPNDPTLEPYPKQYIVIERKRWAGRAIPNTRISKGPNNTITQSEGSDHWWEYRLEDPNTGLEIDDVNGPDITDVNSWTYKNEG